MKSFASRTPLVLAIFDDRLDIVEALLNGANIDRLDYFRQLNEQAGEGDEAANFPLAWAA